jgi:hypothetical protein
MIEIKPGCDVETLEDFARYYEASYMESRDGRVLQVNGFHGKNLVLLDHAAKLTTKTEGYVFMPWSEVQDSLVYGRPSGSLLKVGGKVYMMYVPNNRMAGRGFRGEYYRYTLLRRGRDYRWPDLAQEEHKLAQAVFFPPVITMGEALKSKEDSILSRMYSMVLYDDGSRYLYRRAVNVGRFERADLLKLPTEYGWIAQFVRDDLNFKGDIIVNS